MLHPRSVAVVGASDRPDSFGWRMATEALRSPGYEQVHLVNPARDTVLGLPCVPSLAAIPEPVDLALLGVPDAALLDQVRLASDRTDGGAVVFGPAHGLHAQLRAAADGLEICGGGCMGFVNVSAGVRAIGYLERAPLPAGPIALVTHSGSVFSALLRTRRRLEYSLVVSSGQELVTTTADYLAAALAMPQTRVVGLVLETMRDVPALRAALREAAERDVPVVALTVGRSARGRRLVDAHSGALAGSDAAWEAVFDAYGVHRCDDLAELADSLETFAIGRRVRSHRRHPRGIATVHDSGAERVLVADLAAQLDVPFAPLSERTRTRLTGLLDTGLSPTNPLDVWGRGADSEGLFADCLTVLAEDESVAAVALAVDLVEEYDGDDSFPRAVRRAAAATDKPLAVLANLASAIDHPLAAQLRADGIPVLEGTRSGLRALGHLLAHAERPPLRDNRHDDLRPQRRQHWRQRLGTRDSGRRELDRDGLDRDGLDRDGLDRDGLPRDDLHRDSGDQDGPDALALVADYGIPVVESRVVDTVDAAVAAAAAVGYPVVLKTANPSIRHKTEVDGVRTGLADAASVRAAFTDLADRLGALVQVQQQVPAGVELALGVVTDPLVGALVLAGAGGTLVELLEDRAVALPPVDADTARRMLRRLKVARLLAGHRGAPPADLEAAVAAVVAVAQLAAELGDRIEALDVNPLVVGSDGAVAVDALVIPRTRPDRGPSRNPWERGS